jgi:hypothetical protein
MLDEILECRKSPRILRFFGKRDIAFGVQEVVGSNPAVPISDSKELAATIRGELFLIW